MNNELNFRAITRVFMWDYNRNQDETATKELFIQVFGPFYGNHFYDKYLFYCKGDVFQMIKYLGTDAVFQEKFCDMINQLVDRYELRTNSQKSIKSFLPDYPEITNNITVVIDEKHTIEKPSETDLRAIQLAVCKNNELIKRFRVYDIDEEGNRYEMMFQNNGVFSNKFTSNCYTINSLITLEILCENNKNN